MQCFITIQRKAVGPGAHQFDHDSHKIQQTKHVHASPQIMKQLSKLNFKSLQIAMIFLSQIIQSSSLNSVDRLMIWSEFQPS